MDRLSACVCVCVFSLFSPASRDADAVDPKFGDLLDAIMNEPAPAAAAVGRRQLFVTSTRQSPAVLGGGASDAMIMIGAEQCVSPQLFDEAQANIHRLLQEGEPVCCEQWVT